MGDAQIWKLEDGGESNWQLQGNMKAQGRLCVITVCYENPLDKDWAVETWKSIFISPEQK